VKILDVLRSFGQRGWSKFARPAHWRAFVSWQTYYRGYLGSEPGHALIQHSGPWVGDAARQVELIDGMSSGHLASIVWAPPGCGKSRFALELARRIEKGRDRWQPLFVLHDETIVREELQELSRFKRLVLIVDDAHECPELVKLLANVSMQSSPTRPVYLVCVTRTTGRAEVSRALNGAFPPGVIQEFDLGRPSTKLVRNLIDKLLPKASPLHRDTIERFVRQSYFGAVLVCTALSRELKLPQTFQRQYLRDRVCRQPLTEVVSGVCPVETALRALAVYAALAPVTKNSASVRELAAQLSELTADRVEVLLDRVLAAGLFHEYGRGSVRPIPDLLGDLILEEACLDMQGQATPYSSQLLQRVVALDSIAAVANCAAIGQLFGTAQDVDLVSKLVLQQARAIPTESKSDLRRLLQTCQPLSVRRPTTIIEVANILESRGILRRNLPADDLYGTDSIEMNTCALLMSAGEVDPTAIPAALQLGRDLYLAARDDEQSRQPVQEQLEAYCRFEMGRTAAHARTVVDTLRTWITESDVQVAALATSLSGQFLVLEVEGQHRQRHTVNFSRAPLNPAPEVCGVRDIAVDALVRGTSHADTTVQRAALGALETYAYYQLPPEQVPLDGWRPQLTREIGRLIDAMIKLVKNSQSLPVWAAVEQQGWLWWAHGLDVLHQAGTTVLEAIPDSDAYRLWKSLHAQSLSTRTAIPKELSGNAAARVDYFQNLSVVCEEAATDQARELFEALDPRYPDVNAWRALWLTALEQVPPTALHICAGAVLREFARRHPDVAWSFMTESDARGSLFAIVPMLLAELRNHDRARASQAAREVSPGSRLEDAWMQVLCSAQELGEFESVLLARGLGSSDAAIRRRAAAALLQAANTDRISAFRNVCTTIAQHPADELLWAIVIEQFVNWTDGVLPPQCAGPTEAMVRVADEIITLLQTYGPRVRWGYQQHTRQLPNAFAILAILHPARLQDWMQQAWGTSGESVAQWNDESPLGVNRLTEIMRLLREGPAASHWTEVFTQWILRERHLGAIGALGLAQLCTLDHARVGELVEQIGRQPTDFAVKSFAEFIQYQKCDRAFAQKALAMLEVWSRFQNSYEPIENAVVYGLVHGASGRALGQPSAAHVRAVEAIEAREAQGTSSGLFRSTLERAKRELRAACY